MQRGSEEYTRYILRANHTVHFMKEHCTRWKVESGITGSIYINLIGDGRCDRCQAASPFTAGELELCIRTTPAADGKDKGGYALKLNNRGSRDNLVAMYAPA